MGGGVRIGQADKIRFDQNRTKSAGNSDLLHRIHTIREADERELMFSAEPRMHLHLNAGTDSRFGSRADWGAVFMNHINAIGRHRDL